MTVTTTTSTTRRRTAVGFDGSPSSLQALHWATEQARATGTDLVLVEAWSRPPAYVLSHLLEARDAADRALAGLAKQTEEASGVTTTTLSEEGSPATVLLKAAQGSALLVVGSRGYGGFRGLLIGSVSRQVVQHATCPVVVVRGAEE